MFKILKSLSLALLSTTLLSMTLAQTDIFEINKALAKTINFGNAMETRVEGSAGVYLLESDFDVVKEAGFTAIRLPVKFSAHAAKTMPFAIKERLFKRVDWAVEEALKRDLAIIIDLHHFEAIMRAPEDSREMLVGMWQQIAERYKDAPETVIFEVLNEPNGAIEPFWNSLLADALAVIRESNPERAVIVGPTFWNNVSDLKTLELPEDDRNLIVTFHNYAPFQFTHQGASWVVDSDDWVGTTWSGTEAEQQEMRALFDVATAWAEAHDRPLFMGEFGAFSAADLDSRAAWTRFVREEAEARGISWAYWEYAAGFGAYKRGNKVWNEPLLKGLIDDSPVLSEAAAENQASLYQDPDESVEARVDDLLSQMTLSEKVGQMTQIDVARMMGSGEWDRGPLNEEWLKIILEKNQVGSILSGGGAAPLPNTPKAWAEMTNALQEATLEYSRLGIPMIYGIDAVHGHNNVLGATIYPHNIGLAASWNPDLIEEISAQVAADVRAVGTHWTFAPVADLGRDARWGRFYESFGEDALLSSELVAASVRGFQASGEVAATVKHFAGYGQPLSGFDRSPAFLDTRTLQSTHLPSFAAGVDAGALTMMVNSGSVNGVPVHASSYMLQDIARDSLGFDGVILSDWEDILKLVTAHKVAKDFKEAVAMSINAGVDMYMVPHDADTFTSTLIALVEEGTVPEARIDEAVSNILTLKFGLGLFEEPFVDAELADKLVIEDERSLAKKAATESITVLEKGSLPIAEDTTSILLVGPSADSIENQMGGWTIGWQGIDNPNDRPPGLTVREALEATAPEGMAVTYLANYQDVDAVQTAAADADVAIVVVGETPYAEGEGDSSTLAFPEEQVGLMRTAIATETPVVVVLIAGRPLIFPEDIWLGLDGLIMAYLPGSEGGAAISDVLFGRANPGGKLPFSWPKHTGQLPITYDALPGTLYEPLYEFGYGLSYTKFLQHSMSAALDRDTVTVGIGLENTGEIAGSEVVQVYVSRPPAGVLTSEKQLVGFAKLSLEPGEGQDLEIVVPLSRLTVFTGDVLEGEAKIATGTYTFTIGQAKASVTLP